MKEVLKNAAVSYDPLECDLWTICIEPTVLPFPFCHSPCRVGKDSNDYGALLEKTTSYFNKKSQLEDVRQNTM